MPGGGGVSGATGGEGSTPGIRWWNFSTIGGGGWWRNGDDPGGVPTIAAASSSLMRRTYHRSGNGFCRSTTPNVPAMLSGSLHRSFGGKIPTDFTINKNGWLNFPDSTYSYSEGNKQRVNYDNSSCMSREKISPLAPDSDNFFNFEAMSPVVKTLKFNMTQSQCSANDKQTCSEELIKHCRELGLEMQRLTMRHEFQNHKIANKVISSTIPRKFNRFQRSATVSTAAKSTENNMYLTNISSAQLRDDRSSLGSVPDMNDTITSNYLVESQSSRLSTSLQEFSLSTKTSDNPDPSSNIAKQNYKGSDNACNSGTSMHAKEILQDVISCEARESAGNSNKSAEGLLTEQTDTSAGHWSTHDTSSSSTGYLSSSISGIFDCVVSNMSSSSALAGNLDVVVNCAEDACLSVAVSDSSELFMEALADSGTEPAGSDTEAHTSGYQTCNSDAGGQDQAAGAQLPGDGQFFEEEEKLHDGKSIHDSGEEICLAGNCDLMDKPIHTQLVSNDEAGNDIVENMPNASLHQYCYELQNCLDEQLINAEREWENVLKTSEKPVSVLETCIEEELSVNDVEVGSSCADGISDDKLTETERNSTSRKLFPHGTQPRFDEVSCRLTESDNTTTKLQEEFLSCAEAKTSIPQETNSQLHELASAATLSHDDHFCLENITPSDINSHSLTSFLKSSWNNSSVTPHDIVTPRDIVIPTAVDSSMVFPDDAQEEVQDEVHPLPDDAQEEVEDEVHPLPDDQYPGIPYYSLD